MDCMGVCNGAAALDTCGVCSGGTSSGGSGRFTHRPHGGQRPGLRGNLLRTAAGTLRSADPRGHRKSRLPDGGFGGDGRCEEVGVDS